MSVTETFFETKIFETKTLCFDKWLSHPGNGGDWDSFFRPKFLRPRPYALTSIFLTLGMAVTILTIPKMEARRITVASDHATFLSTIIIFIILDIPVAIIAIIHKSSARTANHWTFTMLGMSQAKGEAAVLTTDPTWVVWDLEVLAFCVVQHCFDYEQLEWLWRRKERPDSTSRQGKRLELASMWAESRQLESEVRCSQSPSLVSSTAAHWQLR